MKKALPCTPHYSSHGSCSDAPRAGTYSLRAHQMESSGHIHKTSEGYSGSEQANLEETPQNYGLVSWKCNILIKFNGKGSQLRTHKSLRTSHKQSRKWPLLVVSLGQNECIKHI